MSASELVEEFQNQHPNEFQDHQTTSTQDTIKTAQQCDKEKCIPPLDPPLQNTTGIKANPPHLQKTGPIVTRLPIPGPSSPSRQKTGEETHFQAQSNTQLLLKETPSTPGPQCLSQAPQAIADDTTSPEHTSDSTSGSAASHIAHTIIKSPPWRHTGSNWWHYMSIPSSNTASPT
jgi:hypothetical protein